MINQLLNLLIKRNLTKEASKIAAILNVNPNIKKHFKLPTYDIIFKYKFGRRIRNTFDSSLSFNLTEEPNTPQQDIKAKQRWINDFVDQNIDTLTQYTPIQYLSSGEDGEAFVTDENQILKIFWKPQNIKLYKEETNAIWNEDTASKFNLRVYDYGKFNIPDADGYDLDYLKGSSWAAMERLSPGHVPSEVNPDIYNIARTYMMQNEPTTMNWTDAVTEIANHVWNTLQNTEEYAYQELIRIKEKENYSENFPRDYINSTLMQYLQHRHDLATFNYGMRNQTPVWFDPAKYEPSDEDDYDSHPYPDKEP